MLGHRYQFEALGTPWSIETNTEISVSVKDAIQAKLEVFDKVYSRFRSDSLVAEIAQSPGEYEFPDDATKLFDFYKSLYDITNGKVTPLIGEMISRAGYDASYSLQPKAQIPVPTWEEAMVWNGSTVTTTQPLILDVGAAGKGYAVDTIANILDVHFSEYVIDGSGDMRHRGTTRNTVGLEHPLEPMKVVGAVEVQNRSLCASASNRRAWGDGMHHIFDPDQMAPTNEIIATWVIADEAMVADGLATALFFVDAKKLSKRYDFEYARMHANLSVEYSPYFNGKFF